MSYEGTTCPCGNKKRQNTMLCDDCEQAFANHPSMEAFRHGKDLDIKRHAAMILLSLSRTRKNNGPRRGNVGGHNPEGR